MSARRPGALVSPVTEYTTSAEILDYDYYREHGEKLAVASVRRQLRARSMSPAYPRAANSPQLVNVGFRRNPIVRRCHDILIEHATLAEPVIENLDGTETENPVAERIRHLLRFPSGVDPLLRGGVGPVLWKRLFEHFILDLYNSGNGILEWVSDSGDPTQLRRIAPEKVFIVPFSESHEIGSAIDRYVVELDGMPFDVPPERVFHMRFSDPLDDYFGLPPLFSALKPLGLDNELMDFSKTTIENLGVPPYVLEFDLSEMEKIRMSLDPFHKTEDLEAIIEIRDRFANLQAGANRGKPAVAFGYKVRLLGMDMSKLNVSGLVTMSEARIYNVHGVPKILAGHSAQESDPTRANFRVSRVHFIQGTITSLLDRIGGEISPRLMSAFGPEAAGLRLRFDLSSIDVIREQKLKRGLEGGQVFMSGMSSRGVCQKLAGWPQEGAADEFAPVAQASEPDRMPGGESSEGTA